MPPFLHHICTGSPNGGPDARRSIIGATHSCSRPAGGNCRSPNPEKRREHLLAGTGVDYTGGLTLTDPRRMAAYFAKYGTADAGRSTDTSRYPST